MKRLLTTLTRTAAAILCMAASQSASARPDLLAAMGDTCYDTPETVDNTSLPQTARDFCALYYPGASIAATSVDYSNLCYEVELNDGTEVEFDSRGQWSEVSAGSRNVIPESVLGQLLPVRSYRELASRGLLGSVEKLERQDTGVYEVELRGVHYDTYYFDADGKLLYIGV